MNVIQLNERGEIAVEQEIADDMTGWCFQIIPTRI